MKTCCLCGYSSNNKIGWTKHNGHQAHVHCERHNLLSWKATREKMDEIKKDLEAINDNKNQKKAVDLPAVRVSVESPQGRS